MTIKINKKLAFGALAGIALIVAVIVYEVVIPNRYASSYNKNMRASVAKLQPALNKAATIPENPIFNVHDTSLSQNTTSLNKMADTIAQTQTSLKDFKKTTGGLQKLPLSGYFGNYKKAKNTQLRAESMTKEAGGRLNTLQALVTYFMRSNKIDIKTQSQITDVSKPGLDGPTVSAGMKTNSQAFYASAKAYAELNPPIIVQDLNKQIVNETNAWAAALAAEGKAIDAMDQNGYNTALQNFNNASKQIDDTNKVAENRVSATSGFMKPIKELPTLTKQLGL